jgi:hypothetical protein
VELADNQPVDKIYLAPPERVTICRCEGNEHALKFTHAVSNCNGLPLPMECFRNYKHIADLYFYTIRSAA